MDLLDQMNRTAFLGNEFLTWLWYRAEVHDGEFELDPEFGPFDLYFEDKLVVGNELVAPQEDSFKGGHPASSLEARMALRLGKLAREAKMRIARGTQEWEFVLKGHNLQLSGIKIPAVLSREDDEKFGERMFLLEQLETMIKGLFEMFLKLRLAPSWSETTHTDLQHWIAGEAKAS